MLSKKAKYALKALQYLAAKEKNIPVLISEISKKQRIPQKFLEAILLELKRDGILASRKGIYGGYFLRVSPKGVNLGHVIRLIDGPVALVSCVSYKYYHPCSECSDEAACGLRYAMQQLREATNNVLDRFSIADINRKEKLLKKLIKK